MSILHFQPAHTRASLYGSALPLALAESCLGTKTVHVMVTPDHLTAHRLHAEIPFFLEHETEKPEVFLFPDWETLPYDHFSPHQDIISERLSTLHRLQQTPHALVIVTISTLMHRLCPPSFLNQHALVLNENDPLSLDVFRQHLLQAGYRAVSNVMEHGEFAVRGSILDLFPMGNPYPYRIELFDERIESLRRFDPETQRTISKIKNIRILPAREFPLDEAGINQARRSFRDTFSGNPSLCPWYEAISKGQCLHGTEYYLPLFFEQTASLFDYLPNQAILCLIDTVGEQADHFWKEIKTRYEQRCHDHTRPLLVPERCFLSPPEVFTRINTYPTLRFLSTAHGKDVTQVLPPPTFLMLRNAEQPLSPLIDHLRATPHRILLVVESAGRREVLLDWFKKSQIHPEMQSSWQSFLQGTQHLNLIIGPLLEGAAFPEAHLEIVTESQWLGEKATPQRSSSKQTLDPDLMIRNLAELKIGDPVVHLQFGIGRYQGLQTFDHDGHTNEFLTLTYANDDKIYVPVTSLHWISRYTGADSEHAPLHRLGSEEWQKAKKKAAEKIHDLAIELLEIYAKREAKPGHVYNIPTLDYQRFCNAFPFAETPDQQNAIDLILNDLQSPRPMDRLICGDVGFGKTEVAMRAAFVAVQNGKQVCVLVPTTLLAGQHVETFRDRFADWPIHIALLSRFQTAKETTQILDGLAKGNIDIVIGTHKLFQKKVQFHQLGLLIIDEEHRFGVKQKEQMKTLRTHIDVLSMTATPIPRTLNMAMAGIRDVSLITTPPAKRLAIKTFWQERDDTQIREAILREISRGGQVFFLHNQVQTIERVCEALTTLVPEASVRSAHGQLRERDLERIMSDFYHHRFNVLVCTTIIETGIDIPTANTIIIDQAFHFGLAQLHQLRGRVGRSHHQAYAYLLTPPKKTLTRDAIKRLEALVSFEALGAGFILATHDLEIRGAGELLGEDQSGNMHAIGFTLFMDLLDKAVSDLKSGKIPQLNAPSQQGPDIELRMRALLPDDYIPDVHLRLIFYKRIANAQGKPELHDLKIELIDRFGLLPQAVKHLFLITELKMLATKLGIKRIQASAQQGKIEFGDQPNIHTHALIQCIQLHPKRYQLDGPTRLKFTLDSNTDESRIEEIMSLLVSLSPISS